MALQNIFDSHAHYDADRFDPDRDTLLRGLPGKGVRAVLNAGADLASSEAGIQMAEAYPHVYCAVGVHPHDAKDAPPDLTARLRALLPRSGKIRALGEMGLDYHYDFSPRDRQKAVFEEQLRLAAELDLPVIVHDREAHADTMALLQQYRPKGVVHCFSGSAEMAREVCALGMYVGFTGVVTFPNARKPLEALRAVPRERILVETDCPYMAPVPLRGKRCDSSMIIHTAAAMAAALEMEPQALLDLTLQNACKLYGIDPAELGLDN